MLGWGNLCPLRTVESLVLGSRVLAPRLCDSERAKHGERKSTAPWAPVLGSTGLGTRGASLRSLTSFSPHLLADLLLLTGLASSVFILSELFKLCEKFCSRAQKAQIHQEDV